MRLRCLVVMFGVTLIATVVAATAQDSSDTSTAEAQDKSDPAAKPSGANSGKATTSESKSKSSAPKEDSEKTKGEKPTFEKATFGGGCFWCQEAVFEQLRGVKSVVSGYAGGNVPFPTYEMVGSGLTGHAEVIQITFDPKVVPFEDLLNIFWMSHDPTTLNRQGPDEGTQYRSIVLYQSEAQKQATLKSYEQLTKARVFRRPIVTQLVPLTKFYPAEAYHQNYYRRHRYDPYSESEITPKLQMLRLKLQQSQVEKKTSPADK